MAAGAYKGLTIRIGADTTKLSTALRGANSAIYKTQTELNKLNKALKLDPGNQNISQMQFGALSSQATNLAREINVLKQGIGEMATTAAKSISGISIAELANDTRSATLANEDAKASYNSLNSELEKTYNQLNAISEKEGLDFKFGNAEDEINDIRGIEAALNEMAALGAISNDELSEMVYAISDLKAEWDGARDALDDYANVAKLEEMNVKLAEAQAKIKDVSDQFAKMAMKSDLAKSIQPMKDKVDLLSDATNRASDRFSRLNQASKLNPGSIMTAANRAKELQEATEAARAKAQALREVIAQYKANGIDEIARGVGNAAIEYEKAKSKVSELKAELEIARETMGEDSDEAKRLEEALSDALNAAKNAGMVDEYRELQVQLRETEAASRGMKSALVEDLQSVGTAAVNAAIEIGNLMKQVGSAVIDASTEVDAAYRDMRKTVDGTEEQYQELYDAAMKYSQTHVTSADTMLEMEALAGQVGVAADELQNFAEVAANLDVATDIDAETIALQMGQIANVMSDLDPKNIQGFGDALVDLGNNMPAQESAIMQISQRLSSVADVAGMSTPEVLGWAAAIASTGQRSEAAATGISSTITQIQSAVSNGGDSLNSFAEIVGMTADEFKEAWGEDASGVLRKFIGEIDKLDDEAIAKLEDLGIEGVRKTQTLLGLAKTVENVDKAIDISQGAWDRYASGNPVEGIGEAAQEASRKAEGFSGSMAKMKNSAQVLAASLGDYLLPYIDKATEIIQKLTDYIDNMDEGSKHAAAAFGILASSIATVYPIASTVFGVFAKFFGGLRKLAVTSIGGVINAFGNASAAIQLFSEGGIGAIGAAFPKAATAIAGFKTKLSMLQVTLSGIVTSGNLVLGVFGGIAAMVAGAFLIEIVKSNSEASKFNDTIDNMKGGIDGLASDMEYGKGVIADYGKSWKDSQVNMNDFFAKMNEHSHNIRDTREETSESIGMLEKYREVIDNAAGAGDDYSGSMGELKWAVDGLNDVLGTNFDVSQVLAGTYEDESGAVRNLRAEIDRLIDSKKQELQVSAMEEIYTEASKAQKEAEIAYKKARKARRDYVKDYAKEHTGDIAVDSNLNTYIMTEDDAKNAARMTGTYRELNQAVGDTRETFNEASEDMKIYDEELTHVIDNASYLSGEGMGDRESIVMTTQAITDAIIANGAWGDSLGEIQPKVQELAQGLEKAKVGTKEFAELANNNPDVFAGMVEEANGDVQKLVELVAEWNNTQLEEKYGKITWNDDGTFTDLEGKLYEFNGKDWVAKLDVDATGADQKIDEAEEKANSAEGTMDVDGDNSGAKDSVDEAEQYAENSDAEVSVGADTKEAESDIEDVKDKASSEQASITVNLDTSSVADGATSAMSGAVGEGVTIPLHLDTSEVAGELASFSSDAQVSVSVTADTSAVQGVSDLLASIPPEITSNITVITSGLQKATERIASLNDVANKMTSKKRSYKADGNAASSDKAAKNVASLNSAASNMSSHSINLNAYGNIPSGAAASNTWDLVRAISNLQSKTITLTTNKVTNTSGGGKSATGAYIPYDKMPKHAAGIFTRPTLTNIGWVGEDGAELYSGNSLVPLTNRKYSMPYINDISDAVAKKLGGNEPTNNITITVTGVSSPDDVANAIARKLNILNL